MQLARDRNAEAVSHLFDCEGCMRKRPELDRQLLGCGYAPPAPDHMRLYVQPWDHIGRTRHADERDENGRLHLPVCAGYVCSLPEVIEASHAQSYKADGELTQFCEGPSTELLRTAITLLEIEGSATLDWSSKNPEKRS